MHEVRRVTTTAMVVLAALWLPAAAAAQPAGAAGPPHIEIWGAWAVAAPTNNGTINVDYHPPLRLGGTPLESHARQVVNVDTSAGNGIDLGANLFFTQVLGVQGAFTATSADVSGTNGDQYAYVRYIGLQPPDYQPKEYTSERSTPWGQTMGTLGSRSVAVGGVVRWRAAAGRIGGTVAGGVSIDWLTGGIESVGYTQYILGGHSTLFSVTHRVRVGPLSGARFYGPYVGGDVHVSIARRIAVMGGVRFRLASSRSAPLEVVDLVDPNEATWTPELSDVTADLDGLALEQAGRRWHVLVGLKLFL